MSIRFHDWEIVLMPQSDMSQSMRWIQSNTNCCKSFRNHVQPRSTRYLLKNNSYHSASNLMKWNEMKCIPDCSKSVDSFGTYDEYSWPGRRRDRTRYRRESEDRLQTWTTSIMISMIILRAGAHKTKVNLAAYTLTSQARNYKRCPS